jgi:uncharacterized membrane protein YeaQ/YmgE (transglycosylase-associated protein family)
MPKTKASLIILLVVGAVIGSVLNQLLKGQVPEFLTQTVNVGLSPAHLDLLVFQLDFGFGVEMSFCTIIGLVLALFVFRKL